MTEVRGKDVVSKSSMRSLGFQRTSWFWGFLAFLTVGNAAAIAIGRIARRSASPRVN